MEQNLIYICYSTVVSQDLYPFTKNSPNSHTFRRKWLYFSSNILYMDGSGIKHSHIKHHNLEVCAIMIPESSY